MITGAAGFIGSRLAEVLSSEGIEVFGVDNLNSYYSPEYKKLRLERAGFDLSRLEEGRLLKSTLFPHYKFVWMEVMEHAFSQLLGEVVPDAIVHLAAQPGVRYSVKNARECMEMNVTLFMRILEICKYYDIKNLFYASSSSVYGNAGEVHSQESDPAVHPMSVYAVSKRTNEMLAEVYCNMYGMRAAGLRFFSVYGEWGRPDMAPMIFADSILNDRNIELYNSGRHYRDFTYIEDVVRSIQAVIKGRLNEENVEERHLLLNIGRGVKVSTSEILRLLEETLGKKGKVCNFPLQPGDPGAILSDSKRLREMFGYSPQTDVETGMKAFAEWAAANPRVLRIAMGRKL